jgi:tRNA A-37 threonylcarbamoyl transferase component Bud32
MTKNKTLQPIHIAGYHGHIVQEVDIQSFCKPVEALLASGFSSQPALTTSQDREVYRLQLDSGYFDNSRNVQEIYIKRYYVTTVKQWLQTLCYTHKAQKSWRIGRRLLRRGIETPQPIALFSRQRSLFLRESVLLTEGITGGLSLHEYIQTHIQPSAQSRQTQESLREKRQLLKSVAEFLARLHMEGVYHGDFTAHNIFVTRIRRRSKNLSQAASHLFRVFIIDLDSIRSTSCISSRRRIKNLDELSRNFLDLGVISTSDRIRFLRYYLNANTEETKTSKQLFCDVFQRTRLRLKKHQKQFIRST